MGGKVCFTFCFQKFFDNTQQCFALLPYFPANNLNFHWRWWDGIQAIFFNIFYFKNVFIPYCPVYTYNKHAHMVFDALMVTFGTKIFICRMLGNRKKDIFSGSFLLCHSFFLLSETLILTFEFSYYVFTTYWKLNNLSENSLKFFEILI